MYWERSPDCNNALVASFMSRDRFECILSSVHCCDNETVEKSHRLEKVRPLFNALNKKFQEHTPVFEKHSVDEAMIPYFGRHPCHLYTGSRFVTVTGFEWVLLHRDMLQGSSPIKELKLR